MRVRLALLLIASLPACGGGVAGSDDEPANGNPPPSNNPPPPAGTVSQFAIVPRGATPPVGLTLHVGFTENVPVAAMQAFYATWVAANNSLWQASLGQVRIDRIVFSDNHAPGLAASQYTVGFGNANTSNLDVLVWTGLWDIPAGGAVGEQPGQGRQNRIMIVPDSAPVFVLLHESSHLVFRLNWQPGSLLADEYNDGIQDQACIMESQAMPWRWCSDANHVNQSVQPHSCWRQILIDYPTFQANGVAGPILPAAPTAVYNDTP
jgi:hypothetical protein